MNADFTSVIREYANYFDTENFGNVKISGIRVEHFIITEFCILLCYILAILNKMRERTE